MSNEKLSPGLRSRVLQTALVLGLLVATMGAAGVFALSGCPCSPFLRDAPHQELQEQPPEPPVPDAPPPPAGGGAKLLPPVPSGQ